MIRANWSFRGPQRRVRPASELFKDVNVPGAHMATFRRIVRIGPWGIYLGRYRLGQADEMSIP